MKAKSKAPNMIRKSKSFSVKTNKHSVIQTTVKSALALVMVVLLIVAGVVGVSAAEYDLAETGTVINVTDISSSSNGFYYAVQKALDEARYNASASNPYTVNVEGGSYNLNYSLRVYSYTTLNLNGVSVKRTSSGNMLRVGSQDNTASGVTGYYYENVNIIGGTFDGNYGENTIIKAFHTRNFTMDGVTVKNEKEGHMTEFAGVDGLTIRNCTFSDQRLTPGNYGYEAVQLDVLHPFHITSARCEDLPVSNVLIENCSFSDMPRAIGSHTAIHNDPHDNIVIRNNTFTNMSSIAIQGMNWTNVEIVGNYIENSPRGITVYTEPGGCTYLSSSLASKGNTQSHASDRYTAPAKSNINIAYNTLKNIGNKVDAYASYVNHGIAVLGENLTSKSPIDSSDESGGLPAGDYYINGAKIHDNYIDIRGNGIRVEDARNVSVDSNEIVCSKSSVQPNDNFYGIVFRDNVTASSISYNTIKNADVNAVQLDGSNKQISVDSINYNRIETTGKYGIVGYDSTSVSSITDNDVIGTKTQGIIMIDGAKAGKVKWNRVRNCGGDGIYFTYESYASDVSSNTTYRCGGDISYSRSAGRVKVGSNYTSPTSLTNFYLINSSINGVSAGVGTSFKLVPDVRPTNALSSFSYSSSDNSVVSVDSSGRATANAVGYARLTVTSDNGISKSYPVRVNPSGEPKFQNSAPSNPDDPETACEAPDFTVSNAEDGVRISWAAVDGAEMYRVYYRGSKGWTRLVDTTDTSVIDTDVNSGTNYTYTVRCITADGSGFRSDFNPGKSVRFITAPDFTLSNAEDGVRISWSAVGGAAKYRIYYRGSKGWTKLTDTTDTSFTDDDVRTGSHYTYTVRCISSDGNSFTSDYRAGRTIQYITAPTVTLSNAEDGVRISWNSVGGAEKYRVYYRGSRGWTKLTDTTDTSFTDDDVRSGSNYTYTVRCITSDGESFTSDYRAGKKIQFISAPVFSLSNASNGVRISWNAVGGAAKYRVYYRGSKGWTKLTDTSSTSFLDTDVRSGSNYTYTVRCINSNGTSFTSDFRAGKTIKFTK